jgi:hypothetical protein
MRTLVNPASGPASGRSGKPWMVIARNWRLAQYQKSAVAIRQLFGHSAVLTRTAGWQQQLGSPLTASSSIDCIPSTPAPLGPDGHAQSPLFPYRCETQGVTQAHPVSLVSIMLADPFKAFGLAEPIQIEFWHEHQPTANAQSRS